MVRRTAFAVAAASVTVAAKLAAEVAARGERLPLCVAWVAGFVSGGDGWCRAADLLCALADVRRNRWSFLCF